MKKTKLSLVVVLLAIASLAGAQNFSFNVKGGLNLSNLSGDVEDNKVKPGFHIGVGADYNFAPNMAIQSALLYSAKGAKADLEGIDITLNANYLQLPVHFAYKIDAAPGTKVVLHAGPYIAYGVGGEIKGKESGVTVAIDTFDGDIGLMKRLDAGLGLGVSTEFGPILLDLGWDMGLINVARDSGDESVRNQNAYLSVGYRF